MVQRPCDRICSWRIYLSAIRVVKRSGSARGLSDQPIQMVIPIVRADYLGKLDGEDL
jgi:hypothetical protein